MEAIILAGGMGTRLQSVVKDVPKPMADIQGKPFLEYLLSYLAYQNVRKVILSVGYKHETIQSHFANSFRGMSIVYAVENEPLGTGGAIAESLKFSEDENVLILNGDTFFDLNLNELYSHHISQSSDITISLKLMKDFDRYGTVVFANNRISGFEEKAHREKGYINGGVYVLRRSVFMNMQNSEKFSFEIDFLQKSINIINAVPFVSDGYFIDIGIPEDYQKAQHELKSYH